MGNTLTIDYQPLFVLGLIVFGMGFTLGFCITESMFTRYIKKMKLRYREIIENLESKIH